jgi:hypothetical protein
MAYVRDRDVTLAFFFLSRSTVSATGGRPARAR